MWHWGTREGRGDCQKLCPLLCEHESTLGEERVWIQLCRFIKLLILQSLVTMNTFLIISVLHIWEFFTTTIISIYMEFLSVQMCHDYCSIFNTTLLVKTGSLFCIWRHIHKTDALAYSPPCCVHDWSSLQIKSVLGRARGCWYALFPMGRSFLQQEVLSMRRAKNGTSGVCLFTNRADHCTLAPLPHCMSSACALQGWKRD